MLAAIISAIIAYKIFSFFFGFIVLIVIVLGLRSFFRSRP